MATTSGLIPSASDPSVNGHNIYTSDQIHDGVSKRQDAKTAEDVWNEITSHRKIVGSGGEGSAAYPHMTLEDYLAKEGLVREEDGEVVTVEQQHQMVGIEGSMMGLVMESVLGERYTQTQGVVEGPFLVRGSANGVEGGARGKRKVLEDPADKVLQQKQRRMIKNRESAARSRERKQAYTAELETNVVTLEEERATLIREQKERQKKRLKELMETEISLTGRRRKLLRRTRSMLW